MGVLDKLNLIDDIAKEIDKQLDDDKETRFLKEYKIPDVPIPGGSIECVKYLILRMQDTKMSVLKKMAVELKIDISHLPPPSTKSKKTPIKKEIDSSPMIGFISYEHTDVDYANRLSKILAEYNIHAFVAYRNTREAEEFQPDIIAALNEMTFFISIHTELFSKSPYCQQEVGFALAKDVKIIPIKLGKNPDGFIKGITAIVQNAQDIEIITPRILKLLKESPKTKELYSVKVADQVADKVKDPKKIDVKAYTLTAEDLVKDTSIEIELIVAILFKLGLVNNELYHLPVLEGRNHINKFTVSARDKILENYPLDMENRTEKIKKIDEEHRKDKKERLGH